jgi:cell fate regulator YaaT (PSP1 superfamily)
VDLTQMAYYQYKEQDALTRCQQKVQDHDLPMKVVRAEYNYDGSRVLFFFTAEKRVDFRKLVRDLARSFRARVELRQVGVRDEAKLIGGIGKCGRLLCCVTWLTEFSPVSIKMAKQQDLPLSPMEISGLCGRLLCCLSYERDYYLEMKKNLPKRGEVIDTPHGRGKVTDINVIKESVQVELESQVTVEVSGQDLRAGGKSPSKTSRGRRRGRKGKKRGRSS